MGLPLNPQVTIMSRVRVPFQKHHKEISMMQIRRKKKKSKMEKLVLKQYYKLGGISEVLISLDKHGVDIEKAIEEIREILQE